MTAPAGSDAFDWVLAKAQLTVALGSLSPAAFRSMLHGLQAESRARLLELISPHVAAKVEECLRATPRKRGHQPGGAPSPHRPDVEVSEAALRLRLRDVPRMQAEHPEPSES